MHLLVDLLYFVALLISSPVWLYRLVRTGKIRSDWHGRFGAVDVPDHHDGVRLAIHAVSVGEVNAIRLLVSTIEEWAPQPDLVIASTTNTGTARASTVFADRHHVVRYPLDFSWSVRRWLNRVRPDALVLTELEVWPNMMRECQRRGIPVCVVNGRLTERSHRRYRLVRSLVRSSFARLARAGVQNEAYAERFVDLGVAADRVTITGTMKWDTARIADEVDGAQQLATDMGIDLNLPLVVAGSTAPDEHELIHNATPPGVQLLCAPRKPEHFAGAARVLEGCVRRSAGECGSATGRFLLDTIGELRMAYALADVVIIGRSFGELHGSDMIEPIALGKATLVGPAVTDFQDIVTALLDGNGIRQCTRESLHDELKELLADQLGRQRLATSGRKVIVAHQGATLRNAALIADVIAGT